MCFWRRTRPRARSSSSGRTRGRISTTPLLVLHANGTAVTTSGAALKALKWLKPTLKALTALTALKWLKTALKTALKALQALKALTWLKTRCRRLKRR